MGSFFPLLLLAALHVAVAAASSNDVHYEEGIVRIPLQRMESGLEKLMRQGADVKLIEGLYEMSRHTAAPPTNDTLPLFKYFDTQYYGVVNIGKPGREFKMIMDTAWATTWVISEACPRTSLACSRHTKYNHDQSSTYTPNGTIFNVSDKYIGEMSIDVFHVGHLNCSNQAFAEMTKIPWIYALYDTDGTIGLGPRSLSPNFIPFFYNFFAQNKLAKPIFSFYINRDPTTQRGGSLLFGGIDYKHNKTQFTNIKIISDKYYWLFKMDKVSLVKSKKSRVDFCKNGCNAVADTSTNTITGPNDEIKKINKLIGAEATFFSNRYLIPCNNEYKGPKIVFTINNQEFQIKASDYIQKLAYSGLMVCLSAFVPNANSSDQTWTLGGAFLYQYYTAFDVSKNIIMIAEMA